MTGAVQAGNGGRTGEGSHAALALGAELAATLPAILLDARRIAATLIAGAHGRRRAGGGDAFWQHRELMPGEAIRQVDWRRSARSDRLFVREHERENPAVVQVWADTRPSMNWRSRADWPLKAHAALTLALALGLAARAGGEQVGVPGPGRPAGSDVALAHDLLAAGLAPPQPGRAGPIVLVSDGLEPAPVWAARLQALRAAGGEVALVLAHDPAERDFPFQGRIRFASLDPQSAGPVLLGRAEAAREDYQRVWAAHMDEIASLTREAGGRAHRHATDAPLAPLALTLAQWLSAHGGGQG